MNFLSLGETFDQGLPYPDALDIYARRWLSSRSDNGTLCCGGAEEVTCIVMTYIVMAFVVMAYIVMAYTITVKTVVGYIVAVYIVMAHVVMAVAEPRKSPHFVASSVVSSSCQNTCSRGTTSDWNARPMPLTRTTCR